MRSKRYYLLMVVIALLLCMVGCFNISAKSHEDSVSREHAQIFLYGEKHGVDKILKREFEIWHDHYHKDGMRHLFLELPYYTAEFLNIWMEEDNDDILDAVYVDLEGTASHVPALKDFYKQIKVQCPETVFHGTDVGHQFFSTGERFLEYLEKNNLQDSNHYLIAVEVMEQGQTFYETSDDVYRENKMTENFIREFDLLDGEKIMGIYGASHTGLDELDYTRQVPCMANQLKKHYGDIIYSENLSAWKWWWQKQFSAKKLFSDMMLQPGAGYLTLFSKQDLVIRFLAGKQGCPTNNDDNFSFGRALAKLYF